MGLVEEKVNTTHFGNSFSCPSIKICKLPSLYSSPELYEMVLSANYYKLHHLESSASEEIDDSAI